MKPENCYSSNQQSTYNNGNSCGGNKIRVIRLRRRNNVPLGFSVRGGREHGTGIYVSEVRAGSEAHHQGLLVGDQILRINGFNIEHAIHEEVLALLRAKPGVVIKVRSMGMIPVKDTKKDPLTWKIVEPGPSITYSNETNGRLSSEEESRISIPSIGSSGLGCSIVKGPPDIPGIYVQSVKSGSLAEKAGIQVGDRIMEMNGHNFTNLDFSDAVVVLKSSKQMTLVLLKGAGLDLFPEEKFRLSSQIPPKESESNTASSVQEEDQREERDAKRKNGHILRVKNGSDHKHLTDGDFKLNGSSSCSDSDVSSRQVTIIQEPHKFSHSVKVRATVHSSGDDETSSYTYKGTRESGDGMDFESLNSNHTRPVDSRTFWDNEKHKPLHDVSIQPNELNVQCASRVSSEDESYSSTLSAENEIFRSVKTSAEINYPEDKNSLTSEEKSELCSLSSDDYLGIINTSTRLRRSTYDASLEENVKPQNEFLKRKQHELLMEEFQEVHKKMFGNGPTRINTKQTNCELTDQPRLYNRRQQVRKDRVPPPPPTDIISSTRDEIVSQSLQVDEDESCCGVDVKVLHKKRQREPPITDSRDPEPKPPQTYFEKPEPKPLVTIGTYSNSSQQNRFMNTANVHGHAHITNNSHLLKQKLTLSNKETDVNSSSASSILPSSSSSEPRSPTSESVLSSDSLFSHSSSPSITNGKHQVLISDIPVSNTFQATLCEFTKTNGNLKEVNLRDKFFPLKKSSERNFSNKFIQHVHGKMDTQKELLNQEAGGRKLNVLTVKKNGPLNFTIEGGINSALAGKILVSEVWPGSCTIDGGTLELGDQILMVDDTRLTGLSLTAANVALRNANSNANKDMKLIIAKALKDDPS